MGRLQNCFLTLLHPQNSPKEFPKKSLYIWSIFKTQATTMLRNYIFMLRQSEHLHLAFPHCLRILVIPCAILTSLAEALTSLAKALTFLAKAITSLAKSPSSSLAEILQYEPNVKKIEKVLSTHHTRVLSS